MIANRISLHLDLLGPSIPTDTACSSTLTAFHLAVQAVSHREIDAAVVGGCQLNHRSVMYHYFHPMLTLGCSFMDWFMYSQGSLLAPDGMCKPFDASADGYGIVVDMTNPLLTPCRFSRGEGCVAIVIKPLSDAIRDHDHIYASVRHISHRYNLSLIFPIGSWYSNQLLWRRRSSKCACGRCSARRNASGVRAG